MTPAYFSLENPALKATPARVAYEYVPTRHPGGKTVLFLHGLGSDMLGTKIEEILPWAQEKRYGTARLDYPGHGQSEGMFEHFTISQALAAAQHLVDHIIRGPVIVVGSSTGGWVSLLLALSRPERVAGVVTIACAADFTERLYWESLSADEQDDWQQRGFREEGKDEGAVWRLGYELITDGRTHMVLGQGQLKGIRCPVRLLHGMVDDVVPWNFSTEVAAELGGDDVLVQLVKDADHRMNRPYDINLMKQAISDIA